VIVNLARPTQATDRSGHDEHLEIARNLVAAARAAGVRRLIHLGSATEFGQAESPADDDTPLRPTTSFGRAKANASSLVLAAHGDGIRTTVLRPFSVYGSGDRPGHLIPAAIDAAFSGRALQLASGVKRDWVFVEDVASACALALDGRADGVAVNLASGVALPNEQVVELVGGLAGQRIEIDPVALPPRPWDANIAGSTERARQLLGWTAGTGLRDGIRMTLAAGRTVVRHSGMAAAG
jgi:nucleoside-diphosphate-sugar epimerase